MVGFTLCGDAENVIPRSHELRQPKPRLGNEVHTVTRLAPQHRVVFPSQWIEISAPVLECPNQPGIPNPFYQTDTPVSTCN